VRTRGCVGGLEQEVVLSASDGRIGPYSRTVPSSFAVGVQVDRGQFSA
jgi:hypothetical protein